MSCRRKLTLWPVLALALTGAFAATSSAAGNRSATVPSSAARAIAEAGAETFSFRVTIRNLGRADLTAPVYAVHTRKARLFRIGKKASAGLAALAEDGATSQLLSEARRKRGVGQADVGPRVPPGKSASFLFTTTSKHLRLSWASMTTCSNDTFAGQSGARLPTNKVGARKIVRIRALDAGSEANRESSADVPCLGAHNVGPSENMLVRPSPGIQGVADLDNEAHGWGRFLARVTIKLVG